MTVVNHQHGVLPEIPDALAAGHRASAPTVRTFRPDIEALRALAVVLVVLYHSNVAWLPGGYVGVDVFFVVSGFLITNLLFQELGRTGRLRVGRFYARRARRLLPVATLVMCLTVLGTWVLVSGLRASRVGIDALWTSAFAANIHFANAGVDYQANQDPSPLQHYWSLAAEEQFYLVWPFLMILATILWLKVLRRRSGLRVVLSLLAAAIAVTSFVYSLDLLGHASSQAYFLTPSRAWELAIGAFIALAAPFLVRLTWLANSAVVFVGLAAIVYAGHVFTDATPFPGTAALLPTLGAALVIVAGLGRGTMLERKVLGVAAIQGVGKMSYGWYLWHWPLLILAPLVLDRTLTVDQNLGISALALILAVWSYTALEDPVRTHVRLVRSSPRSLLLGAALLAVGVAVAGTAVRIAPQAYRSGASVAEVTPNEVVNAVRAAVDVQKVPGNLDPSLDQVPKDKPDLEAKDGISCMVSLTTAELSEEPGGSCIAGGTEGGDHTVVLVGDSHAYQWEPAMRDIAVQRNWKLVVMTKGGCTLNDVKLTNLMLKRDYVECYAWRQKVMDRIAELNPEMIVTSAAIFNTREGDFTDRWVDGVSTTTAQLVDFGAPVYVIEDTPYPKRDIPDCLAENPTDVGSCTLSIQEAYSDNDRRERSARAAKEAGAKLIDPAAWFCNPQDCPVIVGNTVVYSDNSHVTRTYSRLLSNVLGEKLPKL
ncbi:MAG: acyltransferase family protein [Nocardioidaceae bacterium]